MVQWALCVGWMKLVGSGGSWRVGWVQHVGWSGGTGVSVAFSTLGGPVCLQCQLGFARRVVWWVGAFSTSGCVVGLACRLRSTRRVGLACLLGSARRVVWWAWRVSWD